MTHATQPLDWPAPAFPDPEDYGRMRQVMTEAGFTDTGIQGLLGTDALSCLHKLGKNMPVYLRRTAEKTPLNTLVRLFLFDAPVGVDTLAQAIAPMPVSAWVEGHLVAVDGDWVRSLVKLVVFGDFLVAHDMPMTSATEARADYVMGIGASTLTVAGITIRRPSRNSLDLGTGCGTHALLLASHSSNVFAVDRNPRAIAFTAFNTALNGLDNVRPVVGDCFEPVNDQQFDLIVSNPPFVISPVSKFIYRDSGMGGDRFCQRLIREAPSVLAEGGYCQFLCNWAHYKGQLWEDRVRSWFDGIGCDALVLRTYTDDPYSYAVSWVGHTESPGTGPAALETYDQWMDYFDHEGIEAISGGFISIRKRSGGKNWVWMDDAPKKLLGPCGGDIELGFQLHDFLERQASDDGALLNSRLRVSRAARLNHQFNPSQNRWSHADAELTRVEGLAYTAGVDQPIARLLVGCDGTRPLEQLVGEMASGMNRDAAAIAPQACRVVRQLIERGFLIPQSVEESFTPA